MFGGTKAMNEQEYLEDLIRNSRQALFRLSEGRDLSAVPIAHDAAVIIIKNVHTGNTSLIYKKAISVITPMPTGG